MVVNNVTELDKNECYKVILSSTKTEYIKKSYLIILFSVFGLIIMIMGFPMNQTPYIVMGAALTAMALVYLVVTIVNIKRFPKMIKKNNRELTEYGIKYQYKFKEESVEIVCQTLDKVNKLKYSYANLKKIYEYNDLFLLLFNDTNIIYVKKSGFDDEKMMSFYKKNITKIFGNPNKQRKIIIKNKNYIN